MKDFFTCRKEHFQNGRGAARNRRVVSSKAGDLAKAGRVRIPAAYNKSDEDQWLPLHPQLAEILKSQPDQCGHVFPFRKVPPEVSRRFTKIAKNAGLRISLHDLRRSFGSRYAPHVPAPVLQRLMRHADIKTTLTYYTDVDDALEEAILKA